MLSKSRYTIKLIIDRKIYKTEYSFQFIKKAIGIAVINSLAKH